jgi:ubiquitin-protein ligase
MATKAAMLRLQREIVELEKEPLEGIQYHFRDSDMKHMCLILTPQSGPFRGLRLHLNVRIPNGYPRVPPFVSIQTSVEHPNVMGGGFICCDILQPRYQLAMESMSYNGGYTPAYLLKYIFYQLLSFFSVYEVDQDTGGTQPVISYRYHSESHFREAAEKQVRGYACSACGFNISIPSTVGATSMDVDEPSPEGESSQETQFCYLAKLDTDCWLSILDKLSDQDMHSLARAWSPVKQLQQNLLIRRQLVCFYLRKTHMESVLGIGLRVSDEVRSTAQGRPRSGFVGRAATIRMLDLLSLEAYMEHGVRTGIYGEHFNVFLPIAIDPSHFTRAEIILRESLLHIHRMWVRPEKVARWPLCIVEVLPRLMNHMVLELVKDCDTQLQNSGRSLSSDQRWTVKRSSEKALQGYCLLLDLFEKLANRFPEVERELRSRVSLFRRSQGGRHKSRTPDLGMFLTYLLVLKEDWSTYCVSFIEELLARNVVWYLDGSKTGNRSLAHLAHLEDDTYVSLQRLQETFAASSHSLKLFMFQVSFLRLVSKGIDSHYGYPSPEDSRNIFQQTQEIYAVKDWDGCLRICEYQLPESARQNWRPHVCKMLKMAVSHSETAKYHVVPCSKHQLYYWRSLAERTCPTPSWWHFGDPDRYTLRNLRPGVLSFFPRNR